jgi:hypothetical protein
MLIISHRGNINGPDPFRENKPESIMECIERDLNVEIDVWYANGAYYLGHDLPQYEIDIDFLRNKNLWCHTKNLEALSHLQFEKSIHSFWHQNDDFTLTSQNIIWTYPNKPVTTNSVIVSNEMVNGCYGICTDFPLRMLELTALSRTTNL